MQQRSFALFALILLLLVAACSSPSATQSPATPNATAPSQGVTLRWSVWGSPEELASHQAVADAFMQAHPSIKIVIEHTPWEGYHTKLKTIVASGDLSALPDVMFLGQDFNQYASEGVLENLTPWIERSGYDLNDYWPALIERATINGGIYGLQRDLDLRLLYYNKDLFDEAGIPYPDETWTWNNWAEAAKKLSIIEASGRIVRYGIGMETGKWGMLLAQSGGAYLDDPRNPSRCTLDTPESLRALNFYADLLNANAAMRPATLQQIGGDAGAFTQKQVAMIVQNASRAPTFGAAGMNFDVAPIPIPEGGRRVNNSGGARWVMSSASKHKEEAWTFLKWLQSANGGIDIYTKRGEIFPALRSVAQSPSFLQVDAAPRNRQAFVVEARNVSLFTFGDFPEFGELNDLIIEPNLQLIWSGQASVEQTVPEICRRVNEFLKQNGYPRS
ncbi:MAG: sugar ABC transporter substrate-binding protein [Roseiflexus sp.]|jgi:multiple sugar transport system substrate-binding protein|nr:sugar ABC transporter substrate-binding protein [Roseiflexus sp.]MBO9387803.1 sugar ABC transporter substrate-binding protein [Roseiflexus sp.]